MVLEGSLIEEIDLLVSKSSQDIPLYILVDYDKTLIKRDAFLESIFLSCCEMPARFIAAIACGVAELLLNDLPIVRRLHTKGIIKYLIARAIKKNWQGRKHSLSLFLFYRFYDQCLVQALIKANSTNNVHVIVVTNNITFLTNDVCGYLGFGLIAQDTNSLDDLLKPTASKSVRLQRQHPEAIRQGLMLTITDRYIEDIDLLRLPPKSCIHFDNQLQLFFSSSNGALR